MSRNTTSAGTSKSSQSNSQRRQRSRSTSRYADLEKPKKKKTLSATTSLVSIPNTIKLSMLNSGLLSFERVKLEARDDENLDTNNYDDVIETENDLELLENENSASVSETAPKKRKRNSDKNNSLSQTIPDQHVELRHFVKLCEQRRKFPVLYKLEFQTAVKVETNTCKHATRKNNLEKNQNQKCIPYDYNRVVLNKIDRKVDSDYINASYIDSLLKPNAYIVTQGPTEDTVNDFWRMVWQENVSAIIMLTKVFDFTKVMCMQYWPPAIDKQEIYGDIHIGILIDEQLANFQIRTFKIWKLNPDKTILEERRILQFHYTEWHSHTCPFSNSVLEFRRRVRAVVGNIITANSMIGPMLVHCNDGGGRSGVYLAIDANMESAEEEDRFHVFGYLKKLRTSRKGLIENVDQYKFVYDTLEEHIVCGKKWFPVKELSERLKAKAVKDSVTKMNEYQKEYAQICKQTPRFTIGDCAGGHRADNREKNRDVLCVPPDNFRPYLTSFQGNAFTDYINAVFVDGYTKPREYIVTEWPMKHTVGEFWSLVYDQECSAVVVLCNPPPTSQSYPSFWPDKSKMEKYGPVFSVHSVSRKHFTNIKQWEYKINKKIVSLTELMAGVKAPTKVVQLFQLTCFPLGHKVPTSTNSLVALMNMVEQWRQKTDYGPVVVVSPDGRSRAGVYCAANACIEQVIQHGEVDVFQAVKTVRRHRPQLIENMTEYKYCYDLVLHYVLHYLNKDLKEKKFIEFGRGKVIPLTPDSSNADLHGEITNTGKIVVKKRIAKIEKAISVQQQNQLPQQLQRNQQFYGNNRALLTQDGKIMQRKKKGRLLSLGGNDPVPIKKGSRGGRLDRLKTVGTFDLGSNNSIRDNNPIENNEISILSEVARNLNEKIISGDIKNERLSKQQLLNQYDSNNLSGDSHHSLLFSSGGDGEGGDNVDDGGCVSTTTASSSSIERVDRKQILKSALHKRSCYSSNSNSSKNCSVLFNNSNKNNINIKDNTYNNDNNNNDNIKNNNNNNDNIKNNDNNIRNINYKTPVKLKNVPDGIEKYHQHSADDCLLQQNYVSKYNKKAHSLVTNSNLTKATSIPKTYHDTDSLELKPLNDMHKKSDSNISTKTPHLYNRNVKTANIYTNDELNKIEKDTSFKDNSNVDIEDIKNVTNSINNNFSKSSIDSNKIELDLNAIEDFNKIDSNNGNNGDDATDCIDNNSQKRFYKTRKSVLRKSKRIVRTDSEIFSDDMLLEKNEIILQASNLDIQIHREPDYDSSACTTDNNHPHNVISTATSIDESRKESSDYDDVCSPRDPMKSMTTVNTTTTTDSSRNLSTDEIDTVFSDSMDLEMLEREFRDFTKNSNLQRREYKSDGDQLDEIGKKRYDYLKWKNQSFETDFELYEYINKDNGNDNNKITNSNIDIPNNCIIDEQILQDSIGVYNAEDNAEMCTTRTTTPTTTTSNEWKQFFSRITTPTKSPSTSTTTNTTVVTVLNRENNEKCQQFVDANVCLSAKSCITNNDEENTQNYPNKLITVTTTTNAITTPITTSTITTISTASTVSSSTTTTNKDTNSSSAAVQSTSSFSNLFEKRFGRFKKMNKLLKSKRFSTSALYDKKNQSDPNKNLSNKDFSQQQTQLHQKPPHPPTQSQPTHQQSTASKLFRSKFSPGKSSSPASVTDSKSSSVYSSKLSLFNQLTSNKLFSSKKSTSHSNTELNLASRSRTKLNEISKSHSDINKCRSSPLRFMGCSSGNDDDPTSFYDKRKYMYTQDYIPAPPRPQSPLSEEFYNKTGSVRLSAMELYEKFCSEDFHGLYKHEDYKHDERYIGGTGHRGRNDHSAGSGSSSSGSTLHDHGNHPRNWHEYRLEQRGLGAAKKYGQQSKAILLKQKSEPKFSLNHTHQQYHHPHPPLHHQQQHYDDHNVMYFPEEEDEDIYEDEGDGEREDEYYDEYEDDEYEQTEEEVEDEEDEEVDDEVEVEEELIDEDEEECDENDQYININNNDGDIIIVDGDTYPINNTNIKNYQHSGRSKEMRLEELPEEYIDESIDDDDDEHNLKVYCSETDDGRQTDSSDIDEIFLMPEGGRCSDIEQYGFENKHFSLELCRSVGIEQNLNHINDLCHMDDMPEYESYGSGVFEGTSTFCGGGGSDEVLTIYKMCSKEDLLLLHKSNTINEIQNTNTNKLEHETPTKSSANPKQNDAEIVIQKPTSTMCGTPTKNNISYEYKHQMLPLPNISIDEIEPTLLKTDCTNLERTESIELLSSSSGTLRSGSTLTEYAFDTVRNLNLDSCSTSKLSLSLKSEIFDDFSLTPDELQTITTVDRRLSQPVMSGGTGGSSSTGSSPRPPMKLLQLSSESTIIAKNCDFEDFTLTPDDSLSESIEKNIINDRKNQNDNHHHQILSSSSSNKTNNNNMLDNNNNDDDDDGAKEIENDNSDRIKKDILMIVDKFLTNERNSNLFPKNCRLKTSINNDSNNKLSKDKSDECDTDDCDKYVEDIDTEEYSNLYDLNDDSCCTTNVMSSFTSEITKEFDLLFQRAKNSNENNNNKITDNVAVDDDAGQIDCKTEDVTNITASTTPSTTTLTLKSPPSISYHKNGNNNNNNDNNDSNNKILPSSSSSVFSATEDDQIITPIRTMPPIRYSMQKLQPYTFSDDDLIIKDNTKKYCNKCKLENTNKECNSSSCNTNITAKTQHPHCTCDEECNNNNNTIITTNTSNNNSNNNNNTNEPLKRRSTILSRLRKNRSQSLGNLNKKSRCFPL